jgi:X-Pro dipeptidyl-peptidase
MKRLLKASSLFLAVVLMTGVIMASPVFAEDTFSLPAATIASTDSLDLVKEYLSNFAGDDVMNHANIAAVAAILSGGAAPATVSIASAEATTQRELVKEFLLAAGLKEHQFANGPAGNEFFNYNEMAAVAGFLDNWNYEPTKLLDAADTLNMTNAMTPAFNGLYNAIHANPPAPYFVNGMAVPIFPYGNSPTAKYNDTTSEGIARYVVYIDTNFDSDASGKLDYVKVLVQLPRAAVEQGMKVSTIYEARPYIEGTNGSVHTTTTLQGWGNTWLTANGAFTHDRLHGTAPDRVPTGEATTKQMVQNADYRDWYYTYTYNQTNTAATVSYTGTSQNCYENLNWYDYYLVRGFAVVSSAGLAALNSTGISTYGVDIEIDAFKCVIEWLTGDRKAYTDKTGTTEVKADWSNGNVGMTGRSYAGGTQFALATTGVKGLKAVVPVAGTSSYYDYQNSGGGLTGSNNYTQGMAWYINSRAGAPDWLNIRGRQAGYIQQMLAEATALNGNYGDHWARREYTVDGWFKDWGPSKIKAPMLIVHGVNDDNVRAKQSVNMYNAAKFAGVPTKMIWSQGDHMTPTFPLANPTTAEATTGTMRPHGMSVGIFDLNGKKTDLSYDDVLNLWFSHFLYGVDNDVLNVLPDVIAQDNYITPVGSGANAWVQYDSWEPFATKYLTSKHSVARVSSAISTFSVDEPGRIAPEYVEEEVIPPQADDHDIPAIDEPIIDMPVTAMSEVAAAAASPNIVTLSSASAATVSLANLRTPTAGSIVYTLELPEDFIVKGVVEVNIRAAFNTLGSTAATDNLRMHVTLAEVPRTANTIRYYGAANVGTAPGRTMVQQRGAYMGSGVTNFNLVRFTQITNGAYRQITKGWFDLCNPKAGFEAFKSDINDRIVPRNNIGVFHDYTVYLQPTVHTAKAGNQLAALITFGVSSPSSTTGNAAYTVDVDLDGTYVALPSANSANNVGDFKVTFVDWDGETLDTQFIEFGNKVVAPPDPHREGYRFDGWFTSAAGGKQWDFATAITTNLQLYARWTKYTHTVYLRADKTKIGIGDTLNVDVMLVGDINYTQLATEVLYDTDLLEFDSYANLNGWAAAVSKSAANKVAVRSIPGMNMVAGVPCSNDVTIVTLKFKVKDDFTGDSINTVLSFASALVSPPGGVTGTATANGDPMTFTLQK